MRLHPRGPGAGMCSVPGLPVLLLLCSCACAGGGGAPGDAVGELSGGDTVEVGDPGPPDRCDHGTAGAEGSPGADADARLDVDDGAGGDGEVDVAEVWDPSCHYDCFGYHECKDGVVTTYDHVPVPCEYWKGGCPIRDSFQCEKGCRVDGVNRLDFFEDPRRLCQEGAPKHAGDPCAGPADCLPTPAEVVDGEVVNTYLTCDEDGGKCVVVDPPAVLDWLAPCRADLSGLPPGAYGYVTAPACSAGVCLIAPGENGCVTQGCTKRCQGDHECPPGAVCQDGLKDWADAVRPWGGTVCKPGPPDLIGVDLVCPTG